MAEYAAKGTVLKWGGTQVGNIVSFSGPGVSGDTIDVSDLSDTYKQFISAGLSDAGEITCEVNLDPNTTTSTNSCHNILLSACKSGASAEVQIEFTPTSTEYTANGFVTAYSPKGSVGDADTCDITFKLTGELTADAI